MNHYPRHIGDMLTATIGMTLAERGAYAALLDQYYAHEGPLPLNKDECYRLAAAVSPEERKAIDYVLSKFFKPLADGWNQKRCNDELALYRERSASASASAQARWGKGNANAMRTHSDGNASHKPVAINHKPIEPKPARQKIGLAEPTPEHQALADSLGVACKTEWAKYRDWMASSGKQQKDEAAGFRNWLRKAAEFRPKLVEPVRQASHVPAKLPANEPRGDMPDHIRDQLAQFMRTKVAG